MPLTVLDHDASADASDLLATVQDGFLIFYSSVVDGKLWCPDCRDVEELVQKTFSSIDAPKGLIIYVGDRSQWKDSSNAFRAEPFKVRSVPTIIKIQDANEVARLVDAEIAHELAAFLKT